MQRVMLLKKCRDIQAAHLYEHMYCNAIDYSLQKQYGLFDFLDYRLSGKTNESGFILIDVDLYSKSAQELETHISTIKLTLSEAEQARAEKEIMTEKQAFLAKKTSLLNERLNELNESDWINFDDLSIYDTYEHSTKNKALRISLTPVATTELRVCCKVDPDLIKKKRELVPLFGALAMFILDNMFDDLQAKYCCYMNTAVAITQDHGLEATARHRVLKSMSPQFKDEPNFSKSIVKRILQSNFIARMVEHFQTTSAQNWAGPSETHLHMKTGVLIGAAGWRKIGIEKNITEILKHTTLQLTLGREKQSFELKELF